MFGKTFGEKVNGKWRLRPAELLVLGFAALIAAGTFLLTLPVAAQKESLSLIEALFTATSAVCVTGLSVFDPGTTLTVFGQVVLLVLIQVGGLGFMTITSSVYLAAGKRISLHDKAVLSESLNDTNYSVLPKLTVRILIITAVCELTGAFIFSWSFVQEYGIARGLFISLFHAVSSFCNAGFDIFGNASNLIPYAWDPVVNIVTMALIVIGGLGFFVVIELCEFIAGTRRARHLSLQTRVVLTLTAALILGGALIFYLAEGTNEATLGWPGVSEDRKIMASFFQSVSTRTAGFMTILQQNMRPVSKVVSILFMVIGASPGGTGGGLKTTTAAVLAAFIAAVLKGRKDINMFRRRINVNIGNRAVVIFALGVFVIAIASSVISLLEPEIELGDIIFETTSAFGTTGLSCGITGLLSVPSLIVLILTMFGGRVGFFTFSLVLAHRFAEHVTHVRYPEEKIAIG